MADGLERMLVRWLDPESGTDGQVPVISGGKFVIGDQTGSSAGLEPLTTEIAGVPDFVWDDDNQLVMTEAF